MVIIFLILVLIILFWQISLIVAIAHGAPAIYAKQKVIIKAFESVGLKSGQTVVDLGCGNARSLVIAAKNFGARGIGIEISPFYYLLAKINVLAAGGRKNIEIYFGDFRKRKNLVEKADVVFLYLFDKIIGEIEPWIFKSTRSGAKTISLAFPFKNHRANTVKTSPPIFIYKSN